MHGEKTPIRWLAVSLHSRRTRTILPSMSERSRASPSHCNVNTVEKRRENENSIETVGQPQAHSIFLIGSDSLTCKWVRPASRANANGNSASDDDAVVLSVATQPDRVKKCAFDTTQTGETTI